MKKILLLFIITPFVFSQSKTNTLENKIYNAIDVFVTNPTAANLQKLEASENNFRPKSKTELLAFVILKCNKAYYENQFGQTKNAISSYEKAWQLYQKNQLSNYDIVESCLQPLGNLYAIIGDYENAENTIKQYFYIANAEKNQQQKYAAILNLSNVYQNTGRQNKAIDLLEKTVANETLSSAQKGTVWNNLGNSYLSSGNSKMAGKCYGISINFLKNEKDQSETLSNSYRNTALLNNDLLLFEKAKKLFFETKNKAPQKIAKIYQDEATLLYQQGQFEKASQCISLVFKTLIPNYNFQKGFLPIKNSLYAETVLLDALDLQADLFLTQNQPKKAIECYQLSFHIEELFEPMLVYENSKIISQIRNRNRTEKCIAIYYDLFQEEKKPSYVEKAFLLAEKTKSVVLKQSLLASKNQSREEKLILEQLQNWNTSIVKEQQKLEKAVISKINEAIKKQNELMLLLKSKQNETTHQLKEVNITDLYSKLENGKAQLVEYFFGREKIYVFTIADSKIKLELINSNSASTKFLQFIDCFATSETISNNPSAYNQYANAAYKLLKLPKKANYINLIIVPDGILNFLPFEALITHESKSTNFSKMHYLLNDFRIGYCNSADFYLNAFPLPNKKQTVLGVFPVFQNSDLELEYSIKELQNIKANFDGNYLENKMASFENFKLNAANYSILHLSTHASSGDIVEPASIKFYDQEVLYSELYNLDFHPDLVVLSACETGIGKLYKAEGALSVARGFQFAGAQNLLFSLWKVNDYTTSVLMDEFYKNVKKGHSYFEANHQAKLDFLSDESISNAKKSPYYWSAFVYYGTLEKKEETDYWLWIAIVIGITALLLFLKFKLSKKK